MSLPKFKRPWLKLAVGVFLIGLIFFFLTNRIYFQNFSIQGLERWVETIQRSPFAIFVFFVVFAVGCMGLPITLFPVIGGILFEFWLAFPVGLLAGTAGAVMAFFIARFFGREAIEPFIKRRLKSADDFTLRRGLFTVIFTRWLGVPPFLIANYLFGLSAVRFRDYLIGTLIGCAPWVALVTYFAHSLWDAALIGGQKGFQAALAAKSGPMAVFVAGVVLLAGLQAWIRASNKEKLRRSIPH